MQGGLENQYDCIKALSETEDLARFDVPTLVTHGDDEPIVPIGNSGLLTARLVKGATLEVREGDHGLARAGSPERGPAGLRPRLIARSRGRVDTGAGG